jgi:hypothetical protein
MPGQTYPRSCFMIENGQHISTSSKRAGVRSTAAYTMTPPNPPKLKQKSVRPSKT